VNIVNKYVFNNNTNESPQSAYKRGHSKKKALAQVKNIMLSINHGKPVLLVPARLAALDTVYHNVLFSRLKKTCSVSQAKYLNAFNSAWNNTQQRVFVHGILNSPLVFTIYTSILFIVELRALCCRYSTVDD